MDAADIELEEELFGDDEPLAYLAPPRVSETISWVGALTDEFDDTVLCGLTVLFLDVDGVLHPATAGDHVEHEADLGDLLTEMAVLELVLADAQVAVVLSST